MENQRTRKVLINSIVGVISYTVITLLTFLSRKIFVDMLGFEFLGINSLFTTIISTLSIVDLGIGTAITFCLYKPLAEGDQNKVSLLILLYKKIYAIIGFIVLGLGVAIIPFLPVLTKHAMALSELIPIYVLFLGNSFLTYFFTYNHTLLNADQKNFIVIIVNTLLKIIVIGLQIAVLYMTSNFLLYLTVNLVITLIANASLTVYVKRKYAFLKSGIGKLDQKEVKSIKNNVSALIYHSIGNYLVTGTDNLIISGFLGVVVVAYYSNYLVILTAILSLITNLFAGIVSGFGNLVATQEKPYVQSVFKKVKFVNYMIYTIAATGLFVMANPLLRIWIGSETILNMPFLVVFVLNFFITGYSSTLSYIRVAAGIFKPDKYLHIAIAVINLVVSLILVNFLGIIGVLLGTTICLIIKECIVLPRIGSKYIYGGKTRTYYLRLIFEFAISACIVLLSYVVYSAIPIANSIADFAVGVLVCLFIPTVILSALYFRTAEFKYFLNLVKKILHIRRRKGEGKDMSSIDIVKTELDGVIILAPKVFGDNRGWFTETYSKQSMETAGICYDFVQDNQSYSAETNTLRGLHFQNHPYAQAKLVRCTRGRILDVAVDIRKGSPTFGQYVKVELSEENKKQLLIPRGFAHGFLTLTDHAEVQYKVDNVYSPQCDRSIRYDDPTFHIEWGAENPTLSDKDKNAPLLKDSDCNFSQKVLVTGANGQLGYDMLNKLRKENCECLGADMADFDITDEGQTRTFVLKYRPDVIIHCAAYTAVDKAESEAELCRRVNGLGAKNLASVAKELDCKIVYVSTDYVYDGKGSVPFQVDDHIAPLSVYGKTKLEGENYVREIAPKHFVVRTSWLFGKNGKNFITTMLRVGKEKGEVSVVDDQIGSPTYSADLAELIFEMIQTDRYGVYNASNEGFCSWYEFAREIFTSANMDIGVNRISTADYKAAAVRPMNSRLDKSLLVKEGFHRLPSWEDALHRYIREIKEV